MGVRPVEGLCPVCLSTFPHKTRSQGGGKLRIFCSPKCRSLDWSRGNRRSRKASITKYETVPVNKVKKRDRTRKATLLKYGWTEADFERQLDRQQYSCGGCLARIDRTTARIDHDHATGRTRGLLCSACNFGLGHLRDDPTILRRLMAYMDRDITQTHIYLIGALKNPRIPVVGNKLRDMGFDVMDEWHTPGPEADTNWQAYETLRGRNYSRALRGRSATNAFLFDRAYLDQADLAILIMPAGKSGMLELGYASGRGKTTCLYLDGQDPDRYDLMPNFADYVISTEEALIEWVKGYATTFAKTDTEVPRNLTYYMDCLEAATINTEDDCL